MEAKKSFSVRSLEKCNAFALKAAASTANSACLWLCNQPKFPEAANKFKKVR